MIPAVLAAVPAITELVKQVLNRVLPAEKMTQKELAEIELQIAQIDWQNVLGQLEINKAEAQHQSIFVAGWRPFIGWVCGSAYAWTFVVGPMLQWIVELCGKHTELPVLQLEHLQVVMLGMLGLGAFRTYEKVTGAKK